MFRMTYASPPLPLNAPLSKKKKGAGLPRGPTSDTQAEKLRGRMKPGHSTLAAKENVTPGNLFTFFFFKLFTGNIVFLEVPALGSPAFLGGGAGASIAQFPGYQDGAAKHTPRSLAEECGGKYAWWG